MDGRPRKVSPLLHEPESEEDTSWADVHDAFDFCTRESLGTRRLKSFDANNSAYSFASSSAASMREDDLAPARARPRISYAAMGGIDLDDVGLPRKMSMMLPSKKGGSPKEDNPSWDDLGDEIQRAMQESLHLSRGDLQIDVHDMNHFNTTEQKSCPDINNEDGPWNCTACTYFNENPLHLVCGMCGTARAAKSPPLPAAAAAAASGLNSSFTSVGSQSSHLRRRVSAPSARHKTEETSSFTSQSSNSKKPPASAAAATTVNSERVKSDHNSSNSLSGSERSLEVSELVHDDLVKNIEKGLGELQASIRSQGSNPEVYEDLRSSLLSLQDQVHVLKPSLTKKAQTDDGMKSSVTRRARFSDDQADTRSSLVSIEKLEDLEPSPPKSLNQSNDSPGDLRASLASNQTSSEKDLDEFGDSPRSLRDDMKFRHQYNLLSNKRSLRHSSIGSTTDDVSMASSSSRRSGRFEIDNVKSSRSSLRGSKSYRRSSLELDFRDDASLTSELDQSYYSYSDEDDRTTRTMQTIKSMRVPEKEATIIYTDVQGSTSLWEAHPLSMKKATDVHDSIIRKCYSEHGGYEISTEGDSFNLAFQHPADAIGFALKAQLALYKANWPEEILSHEDGNFNEKRAFRGFRVRMGMHHGPVESSVHETTGRTIYQGEAVDIAKSIEKMSHGGQILTTVETWRAVSGMAEQHLGKPQVMDCGEHLLYDPKIKPKTKTASKSPLYQSKRILQLVPNQLAYDFFAARGGQEVKEGETPQQVTGRVFPPLLSHGQLSTSFLNAPFSKNRVAMVFVYTDKMELAFDNERKSNQKYLARYIRKHLMQLSPPGYECQEDKGSWMLAFDRTENGIKFALELNETVSKSVKLRGDIDKEKMFRIGIHWGPFLSMGPHTITGHADYFGPIVNRAARVAAQCEPGQVCVGIPMDADEEPPDPGPTVEIEVLGVKQLKGITTEMAIFSCRKKVDASQSKDNMQPETKSEEKKQIDEEKTERKSKRRPNK
ncbi:hypothetical protein ACHAXN_004030 [Cyclotella atomus]